MSQSRFDLAAATWDEHPARMAMTRAVAQAICSQVPVRPTMTALDFGCGTGLVTLALQPHVRRILGVDSSPAMLAKLQEKVQAMGVTNVDALLLDFTVQPPPAELRVDLIVSAMALHHIADIPALLQTFVQMLAPGGALALADLDTEDGSFHPDPTGVYHTGIDRAWLMAQFTALGLQDVRATTAHEMERPTPDGAPRRYPIFLISGQLAGGA